MNQPNTIDTDELRAWLRLALTPRVGLHTLRALLTAFGPPSAVFATDVTQKLTVVNERVALALSVEPEGVDAAMAQTLTWLEGATNRHFITLGDADYPRALLETADPPLWLFAQGHLASLRHPRWLAMVGSRNPTPQGVANARAFAQSLAANGVGVVSGLALGIDGAAHEGALLSGGPTIAVVGTGLDRVYPKAHHALAHQIAEHGLIVSEYLLGTPPLAANFPRRNRIISGLACGTLVVEATLQSGSLITARMAAEQGREVFAIPGSIHAPQSKGCHALIRQGAKLVDCAQDILEDLQLSVATTHDIDTATSDTWQDASTLPATEQQLLDAMGYDPLSFEALQQRTGLPTAQLQADVLTLELAGHVARLPGARLQRIGKA
jgi:DNA processing protein